MTRIWTPLIIGFGITLAGISVVSAPANAQNVRARCGSDLSTHCGSVAGEGPQQKMQCLVDNKDSLSPDCQAAVQELIDKRTSQDAPAAN